MQQSTHDYGFTVSMFAARKPNSDAIVIGGFSEYRQRWTRVLSPRAAQMLWFHLARCLFADSAAIIASVSTAPLRSSSLPTITSHITVDALADGTLEASGVSGDQAWNFRLRDADARSFWTVLNRVLYSSE